MADITTLPLTQPRQERVGRSQVIGRMDDDFETGTEIRPNLPKEGTIYFNKSLPEVPNIFQDEAVNFVGNVFHEVPRAVGGAFGDIKDLFINRLIGVEESKPDSKRSEPPSPEEIENRANAQEVRRHNARMEESTQLHAQFQGAHHMKEQVRIIDGMITDEDKRDAGVNTSLDDKNLQNTSSFHHITGVRIQKKAELKEQQEGPIKSPAKQGYASERQFEGGSGTGSSGSGSFNLSAHGGGSG